MRAELIDDDRDHRWRDLLARADASLFHQPQWDQVLRDTYGYDTYLALAVTDDGDTVGGVSWSRVPGLVAPRLAVSPFADHRGPLLLDDAAWEPLFELLCSHDLPITMRCLGHGVVTADPRLRITSRARWHGIDLDAEADQLFDRCAPSARQAIRKAHRNHVRVGGLDDDAFVETFTKLHGGLRKRKYRLLAQPVGFLESLRKQFREIDGWFPLVAFHEERPVAATLYLRHGDVLYYKFNASDPDALGVRPNNILLWEGIVLARELGCRWLDLGASDDTEPGLIRFKRSFGAVEREITRLRIDPPEFDATTDRSTDELLGELTRLFTDDAVPDHITRAAGDTLYRYFA